MGHRIRSVSALSALTTLLLFANTAEAGGFAAARFGADHGQPALSNPYSVYFNPGALGGTEGTSILVDGTFAYRILSYNRPASALSPAGQAGGKTNPDYVAANTGENSAATFIVSPFLGVTTDFGTKNFRLGFATYAPFGGQVSWNKRDEYKNSGLTAGGYDGPQRWHSIKGRQSALYNTLAASYTIPIDEHRLSFGVGLSLVYQQLSTLRARDSDGQDDLYWDDTYVEGRSLLEVSSLTFSVSAGVHYKHPSGLRVGVTYIGSPGLGSTKMSGDLRQQWGTASTPVEATKVDLLLTYPDVIRFGLAYPITKAVELRVDGSWERWSRFKNQCIVNEGKSCDVNDDGSQTSGGVILNIPRNWNDAFGIRTGIGFALSDTAELFGSIGYGSPAIPKRSADPAYFDNHVLTATLGGKFAIIPKKLFVAGSYNLAYTLPLEVAAGESSAFTYKPPSRSPSNDGTYNAQIHFLNTNLAYSF